MNRNCLLKIITNKMNFLQNSANSVINKCPAIKTGELIIGYMHYKI